MLDELLSIPTVTVNRVGRDNGHLGSLSLDTSVLTFHDDNGTIELVPLSKIKRVETDGKLTLRISRSGGPRLQIWMYDFFSHINKPISQDEQVAIHATTQKLMTGLTKQGVIVKIYSGRTVAIEAALFLIALIAVILVIVFAFLRYYLVVPIGLLIAVASFALILRGRLGKKKEAVHQQVLNQKNLD
jgi:hypothetical protein